MLRRAPRTISEGASGSGPNLLLTRVLRSLGAGLPHPQRACHDQRDRCDEEAEERPHLHAVLDLTGREGDNGDEKRHREADTRREADDDEVASVHALWQLETEAFAELRHQDDADGLTDEQPTDDQRGANSDRREHHAGVHEPEEPQDQLDRILQPVLHAVQGVLSFGFAGCPDAEVGMFVWHTPCERHQRERRMDAPQVEAVPRDESRADEVRPEALDLQLLPEHGCE